MAIEFTVTFSEPVDVVGDPRVGFRLGGLDYSAPSASGSGTAELVFAYEVIPTDRGTPTASKSKRTTTAVGRRFVCSEVPK